MLAPGDPGRSSSSATASPLSAVVPRGRRHLRFAISEGDDRREQAGCAHTTSERATELDGVERYVLGLRGLRVMGVGTAGGAGEVEHEGLAVAARPFGDDVGDDPAVVVGS